MKKIIKKFKSKIRTDKLKKIFIEEISEKQKKAFLFGSPMYWNIGDQAIAISEHQLWEKYINDYNLIDVSRELWNSNKQLVVNNVTKDSLILFTGGGYIGDVWEEEQKFVYDVLHTFVSNRYIFFPQTVFFKEKSKLQEFVNTISRMNVTFYTRDNDSYQLLRPYSKENFFIELSPDMVLSLSYKTNIKRKREALFCIRSDEECILDKQIIQKLQIQIRKNGYKVKNYSTVKPKYIPVQRRKMNFDKTIDTFGQVGVVITDRLHGMILSVITGTPVLFFDNLSKKVTGTYQWIKDNKYVICYDETIESEKNLQRLFNCSLIDFDNTSVKEYYDRMFEMISKQLKGDQES